jgi:lipopolysaccharide/colanic/teichoic acid biosynthesis glycosyltransferase
MPTLPSYDLPETELEIARAPLNESGIRHTVRNFVLAARPAERTASVYVEPPVSVRAAKRAIDVVMASLGVLVTLWLLPLLALVIWIDSPGPIFYRQRRAGRVRARDAAGRLVLDEFWMLKLRTMHPDAERWTGPVLASERDPRITSVGRFLRKTRLDELPQLFNVLLGEMSLVGPRPERPELFVHLAAAIPYFEERMHGVKPGITGFAQVSLGYSGRALDGSEIKRWEQSLVNPYGLARAAGSEADDMRMKLLYDLAYVAALDDFW